MMVEATALLVQRRDYRDPDLLSEFKALAITAEYDVIGSFDIISAPSAKYGIRSGKAEEIKEQFNYLSELENWLSKEFVPVVALIEKNVMIIKYLDFSIVIVLYPYLLYFSIMINII